MVNERQDRTSNAFFSRHIPLGVLYDLYGSGLPWSIVVHFQGFPSGDILRCPGQECVQSVFMNVLKEVGMPEYCCITPLKATCIKAGDVSKIDNLSKKDVTDLWEGLRSSIS